MAQHQTGTGWQDFGFALAGLVFWILVFVGAPALVAFLYGQVEPWLPR